MSNDRCKICGVERVPHQIAEDNRATHHKFSETGKLETLDDPQQQPKVQPRMVIANAVDVQLRQLLISKGVLTYEDFAPPRDPGASSTGDSPAGEPSSPS